MQGGPDGHEFFARYDDAIASIIDTACDTVAVFSHGMAIRAWAAGRATNIDGSYASTHQLDTTGMVALDTDPAGHSLVPSTRSNRFLLTEPNQAPGRIVRLGKTLSRSGSQRGAQHRPRRR
jgi:broad specificity phosphatase PhoE